MKTKYVVTILAALWVVILGWISGVDFTTRGIGTFMTFLYASGAAMIAFTYPFYKD